MVDRPLPQVDLPPRRVGLARTALRLGLVIGLIVLLNGLAGWAMVAEGRLDDTDTALWRAALLLGVLLSYALLLAVPFMPGVEIGVSLMLMQGPGIAPAVWIATVLGLSLAYLVGAWVPYARLHRIAADLRLVRICALLGRLERTPQHARLRLMRQRLPGWLSTLLVARRHLLLAVLLNLPGNALLGGGGGLALLAGLSRLYSAPAAILTIALGTAPVPLAVWLWGDAVLVWIAG